MTEFRNKVVHKGYIPVKEEARKYAAWVNDRLFDIVEALRKWQGDALLEITFFDRENRIQKVNNYIQSKKELNAIIVVGMNTPYLTNLNHGDKIFKRESFQDVCIKAKQTMKIHGFNLA